MKVLDERRVKKIAFRTGGATAVVIGGGGSAVCVTLALTNVAPVAGILIAPVALVGWFAGAGIDALTEKILSR